MSVRDQMEPGARPGAIVPRTFVEAQAMCAALAVSDLVPGNYRDKPQNMIVVVMSGAELGIPPMQSLRLYHLMDGVPRLSSEGIRSIVIVSPDCEYFEPQTMSELASTWIGKRRGRPEKSVTWTIERAKKAGLVDRKNRDGSPGNWMKYPEEMLNARASAQLARLVWPHIAAGLISREEASDGYIEAEYTETKTPQFVAPPPVQVQVAQTLADEASKIGQKIGADISAPPPRSTRATRSRAETVPQDKPAEAPPRQTYPEAVAAVEEKIAARQTEVAGSGPTPASPPASDTASTASTSSETLAQASPSSASGAAPQGETTDTTDGAEFGDEDPVDKTPRPPMPDEKLLDAYRAWLASCKTRAELSAGKQQWMQFAASERVKGTVGFEKGGALSAAMQAEFEARKATVPT